MSGRGTGYVVVQFVLLVPALVAPLLGARSDSWPVAVTVLGGLLAAAGLGLTAAASAALGQRNLSPFPKPKPGAGLVQHGIFSVVRHPIYSGLTLFVLGWGMAWSSVVTLLAVPVLLMFFDVKARREERWLAATFDGYADYQRRVRKLVPFVY